MSVAYFDTSALLKHYVAEIGSSWVNALLASPNAPDVLMSHLALIEATCAFARRLRESTLISASYGRLLSAFDYDITYKYNILDVVSVTINTARWLAARHPLRAYDAVHLATAWLPNRELVNAGQPSLTFISADDRLLVVAQAEGLLTENPNQHP